MLAYSVYYCIFAPTLKQKIMEIGEEQMKDWAQAQLWGPRENVERAMNYFSELFGDYKPGQTLVNTILAAAEKQYDNKGTQGEAR